MTKSQRIAELNDALRHTLRGGRIMMTQGVAALGQQTIDAAIACVQSYKDFTPENDPYSEHDFGKFVVDDNTFFFKIDYYDLTMTYGSEHPDDPTQTMRVLTILLASEY